MSVQTVAAPRSTTFKIGWTTLIIISALSAVWHTLAVFIMMDEATLFVGWAAFNLYSTIVLYLPFRRGQKWAWYTSWLLVIGFAAPILFSQESFIVYYLGAAVVMTVSLLLTRPAFFQKRSAV